MASRMTKMPRHPTASVSTPPSTGAATGAMPLMTPMTARTLTSSFAAVTVGGHGTGDDDAAGGPYALEEPHAHEYVYRGREDANHCGSDEQQQGDEEQRPPAELVAQRAEQQLSERETGHARREAHLYHRLRSAEINCHGGERRQVHVRHERTEGREDAEQDDKVVRVACRGRLGIRIGNTGLHCVLFCLQR